MGDGRNGGNVEHIQAGVAHGFAKEQLGVGAHSRTPTLDVVRFDKGGLYAKAAQRVVQQVVRAAIQSRAGHNVRARTHECGNGEVQGRLTTGGADGADAAFEGGHALLQHRVGGVADAAVHMACALQIEQRSRMVAGLKHERGGQVNRHSACAGGGVGCGACVQRERVKTWIGVARHGFLGSFVRLRTAIVGYISITTRGEPP